MPSRRKSHPPRSPFVSKGEGKHAPHGDTPTPFRGRARKVHREMLSRTKSPAFPSSGKESHSFARFHGHAAAKLATPTAARMIGGQTP